MLHFELNIFAVSSCHNISHIFIYLVQV